MFLTLNSFNVFASSLDCALLEVSKTGEQTVTELDKQRLTTGKLYVVDGKAFTLMFVADEEQGYITLSQRDVQSEFPLSSSNNFYLDSKRSELNMNAMIRFEGSEATALCSITK